VALTGFLAGCTTPAELAAPDHETCTGYGFNPQTMPADYAACRMHVAQDRENRDRKTDEDPSHVLYFAEAPDRRQVEQERVQERSGASGMGSGCRTTRRRSSVMALRRRPGMSSMTCRSGRGDSRAGVFRLNRVQFETRRFQFRSSLSGRPWKVGITGFKLDAV